MSASELDRKVSAHYSGGNFTQRILDAIGLPNATDGSMSPEQLNPVDQLHHGGLTLTVRMAEVAGITAKSRVLDAGGGIGGAARYLAHNFDCSVDAIDLSADFVEAAENLDRLCGYSDKIRQQVGSVTALPFDDGGFDFVWSQNVTMNIEDKPAMFGEAFRVLKPGGTYVLTHFAGTGEPIDYPVPWAMTSETSFVTPADVLVEMLVGAGFQNITDHARLAPLAPPAPKEDEPDDSVVMGDDMPLRRSNSSRAVSEGRLLTMMVTGERPI